jgi:Fe-S cluster assembly protein SufB
MNERHALAGVAVDVIFDSVSVATTYKKKLAEVGVIFCSFSEAVKITRNWCQISRQRRSAGDNFLCRPELRGVHRWLILFHPEGRALSDGVVDLLPHQYQESGQFERP